MEYGLFLKGIGLSLQDALRFWREELSKHVGVENVIAASFRFLALCLSRPLCEILSCVVEFFVLLTSLLAQVHLCLIHLKFNFGSVVALRHLTLKFVVFNGKVPATLYVA